MTKKDKQPKARSPKLAKGCATKSALTIAAGFLEKGRGVVGKRMMGHKGITELLVVS